MEVVRRSSIGRSANLTCITTEQFSTSCVSINFLLPLKDAACGALALLPRVLRQGTEEHPARREMAEALQTLYGADIEPAVRKKGEVLSVGMICRGIDRRYAAGEDVAARIFSFAGELLYRPYLPGGTFCPEYVAMEQENLCRAIKARMNEKRQYAMDRMLEEMCRDEAYGKSELGSLDEVRNITPDSLRQTYEALLQRARAEVFYCGSLPEGAVKDLCCGALPFAGTAPSALGTEVLRRAGAVREFTEHMDVRQGKLNLGFRTGITGRDSLYPGLLLLNAMFGGSVSSRLFLHVREKLSLCYYASSFVDKTKGILAVQSGIDPAKAAVTKEEILRQLSALRAGQFTKDEVAAAKKSLITGFRQVGDSPLAMESYYLTQAAGGFSGKPEELAVRVEHTPEEDIIAAANHLSLDTVYLLKGGE